MKTSVITTKITLWPEKSERKEWDKRVREYAKEAIPKKLETLKAKKPKKDKDKQKKEEDIKRYEQYLKNIKEGNEIDPVIITDYTYFIIRTTMEEEAYMKNYVTSHVRQELTMHPELGRDNKRITELMKPATRVKESKKGSLYKETDFQNHLGRYGLCFAKQLTKTIQDAVKNGWLEGKEKAPYFKADSPYCVPSAYLSFSHDYESDEEMLKHLENPTHELYVNYGPHKIPTLAKFKIVLGQGTKNDRFLSIIKNIYTDPDNYKVCDSKLGIKDSKIILYLSLEIPQKECELDENVVVGVDLGIKIPAVCTLNTDPSIRCFLGRSEDFLRVRTQIQHQVKSTQKSIKYNAGGHGRKKKLKPLERYYEKEKNFRNTYNHKLSKEIVDFAVKNHAKYINMENLSGYDASRFLERNWSYFDLQQKIIYKANQYGIIIRKVNPCYSSQVCSVCGNWHPENRPKGEKGQAYFCCHNENCKSHEFRNYNADYNASRNIAMADGVMIMNVFDGSKNESEPHHLKRRGVYRWCFPSQHKRSLIPLRGQAPLCLPL